MVWGHGNPNNQWGIFEIRKAIAFLGGYGGLPHYGNNRLTHLLNQHFSLGIHVLGLNDLNILELRSHTILGWGVPHRVGTLTRGSTGDLYTQTRASFSQILAESSRRKTLTDHFAVYTLEVLPRHLRGERDTFTLGKKHIRLCGPFRAPMGNGNFKMAILVETFCVLADCQKMRRKVGLGLGNIKNLGRTHIFLSSDRGF